MATNRIKGITIEIGGDTTKLDKALHGTEAVLKTVQSDLRTVERQLKMDPGNIDLIAQKERLLGDAVSANKEKLKTLESAAKDVYKAFEDGKIDASQLDAFNLELDLTRSKTGESEKALKDFIKSSSGLGGAANLFNAAGSTIAKGAGVIAKGAATAAKAAAAAVGSASAAVGVLVKGSVQSYSEYEQLVGGVETLFKSSSKTVMKYAQNAYKTAGLSANDYMETVTSFSASLLQGLGGNTEKAAEMADLAITDMADNANKMGTDISSIQSAYQGFAKQNYTMLDNLKLGYGGTQEEMVRLINDSGVLGRQIKDLDGVSFDKIVQAIHVVQTQMGITGTTALEASTTIQGSVASMQAAWENFTVGLADENADIGSLLDNLLDSFMTVLDNIIPTVERVLTGIGDAVGKLVPIVGETLPKLISELLPDLLNTGAQLISALLDGVVTALPELLPVLLDGLYLIVDTVLELLPKVMEAGSTILSYLASAIIDGIPVLADAAVEAADAFAVWMEEELPNVIDSIADFMSRLAGVLIDNAPKFLDAAWTIVSTLGQGLIDYLPDLLKEVSIMIKAILETLAESLPEIAGMAWDMIVALANGLSDAIPDLLAAIPDIVLAIVDGFGSLMSAFVELGANIIGSIIDGIVDGAKNLVGGIGDALSSFFGGGSNSGGRAVVEPYALMEATSQDLPHLAQGTVTRPNSPFLAVVGDNPQEPEVVAPYSTIKQAAGDAIAELGGGASGVTRVTINFTGDLAQLARILQPQIAVEDQRLGPQLVT